MSLKKKMDLSGRLALITGAAGHLGNRLCSTLAEFGSDIVLLDRKKSDCESIGASLEKKYSVKTLSIGLDLMDEEAVRDLRSVISNELGKIEILVNCAAFVGSNDWPGWNVPFLEQSLQTWHACQKINLGIPFLLSQVFADDLGRSGRGSIINISSIYGLVGPDQRLYENTSMGNPAAYATSKAGLLQLTRWLATTLAPKVRINSITPGGIFRNQPEAFVTRYEDKTPLKRMATEEDIQGAVLYLASDLSSYVTGQNLIIDGGWTAW